MGISELIVSLLTIFVLMLASFCVLCLIFIFFLTVSSMLYGISKGLEFCFEIIEESKTYKKIGNYIYNNKSFDFYNKFKYYRKLVFKVLHIILWILSVVIVIYVFCKLINSVDFKLILKKIKTS